MRTINLVGPLIYVCQAYVLSILHILYHLILTIFHEVSTIYPQPREGNRHTEKFLDLSKSSVFLYLDSHNLAPESKTLLPSCGVYLASVPFERCNPEFDSQGY